MHNRWWVCGPVGFLQVGMGWYGMACWERNPACIRVLLNTKNWHLVNIRKARDVSALVYLEKGYCLHNNFSEIYCVKLTKNFLVVGPDLAQ